MKKITYLLAACLISATIAHAKPIISTVAKTVAINFYKQNCTIPVTSAALAYTETSESGQAQYYVFNINDKDGFVIVSADDAALPILGYAKKGHYTGANLPPNFTYWMGNYKKQLAYIQRKNIQATAEIKTKWTNYIDDITPKKATQTTTVSPLVQSTWDQSPYYNAMCPGASGKQAVTGCVATAMAQIMRYWSYPAHGISSSCYIDSTTYGYTDNYGELCAYYDTSNYVWSAMPYSVTSANNEVAKLMYDCGVSVNMDYDPSGSGAWVIKADDSICAQTSYVKYFGYDSATIQGLNRTDYADSTWIGLLQNELLNNRPVQYAGFGSAGGHTWVCDGFDANNNFDMNWGWSGSYDGYFSLNALNPGSITLDSGQQAVIGIEPPIVLAHFNGSPLSGCTGTTVQFTDQSMSPATITGWNWSFPGGTPSTSTAQNPVVTYNTPGTYSVSEVVTSSIGVDSLTQTAYVTIETPAVLPLSQDFESGVFPPAGWVINNPNHHANTWKTYNGAGGFGKSSNCMYYNNCSGGVTGQYDQMHTALCDFSSNTSPFMYFDVAYTPYDNTYSDTLAVYYSTDCGATWNNIYTKGGMTLCTTGGKTITGGANTDKQGCFLPLSTNWRTDTILLPMLAGAPSVMFSFENRSGNGTNMFVDNINIPKSALGVVNYAAATSVTLYPNPNNGTFTVAMKNTTGKQELKVFNVLGQDVYSTTLSSAKTQITLNQPTGIYLYRVLSLDGKTLSEGKLIVK